MKFANLPPNINVVVIDYDTEGVEKERLEISPVDGELRVISLLVGRNSESSRESTRNSPIGSSGDLPSGILLQHHIPAVRRDCLLAEPESHPHMTVVLYINPEDMEDRIASDAVDDVAHRGMAKILPSNHREFGSSHFTPDTLADLTNILRRQASNDSKLGATNHPSHPNHSQNEQGRKRELSPVFVRDPHIVTFLLEGQPSDSGT